MSRERDKGTRFETGLIPDLSRLFPDIQRSGSAAYHVGDFINTGDYVIEAKNHKKITLAAFMDQTVRAAERLDGYPLLIVKRPGAGIERSYVVQEFGRWVDREEKRDLIDLVRAEREAFPPVPILGDHRA